MKAFAGRLESVAKFVGSLLVVLTALAFIIWPLDTAVRLLVGLRFGVKGYVYYEVDGYTDPKTKIKDLKRLEPTGDGNLYLMDGSSDGLYSSIGLGDILQSSDNESFRVEATASSRQIFVLKKGECAIVLWNVNKVPPKLQAFTGGWLYVATTSCGIFR